MPLKLSILVVEDERDIRFIMPLALSLDADMDVRFAASGAEDIG